MLGISLHNTKLTVEFYTLIIKAVIYSDYRLTTLSYRSFISNTLQVINPEFCYTTFLLYFVAGIDIFITSQAITCYICTLIGPKIIANWSPLLVVVIFKDISEWVYPRSSIYSFNIQTEKFDTRSFITLSVAPFRMRAITYLDFISLAFNLRNPEVWYIIITSLIWFEFACRELIVHELTACNVGGILVKLVMTNIFPLVGVVNL